MSAVSVRASQLAIPALGALLTLAGCGGNSIDRGKVEGLLVGQAPTGGATVDRAQCPSGVSAKAGSSFDCKVRLTDGTTGTWTVNIDNSQGLVRTSRSDFEPSKTAPSGPSEVGKTKVVKGSHGGRLRVTLLAYHSNVGRIAGAFPAHVATVQLRIVNATSRPFHSASLARSSILRNDIGTGDDSNDVASNPPQPCAKSFYAKPLQLGPRATVQGCIPYHVSNNETILNFNLGPLGDAGTTWHVGAG